MADTLDPKGLMADAYRINGIGEGECRSIFLDWALSLKDTEAYSVAIESVLAVYESDFPDHPMTRVLRDGLMRPSRTGRRGGRKARLE